MCMSSIGVSPMKKREVAPSSNGGVPKSSKRVKFDSKEYSAFIALPEQEAKEKILRAVSRKQFLSDNPFRKGVGYEGLRHNDGLKYLSQHSINMNLSSQLDFYIT